MNVACAFQTMTGELLRSADQNVIVVDWGVGARPPYTQAVANIRMVASQLAYLIYLFNVSAFAAYCFLIELLIREAVNTLILPK